MDAELIAIGDELLDGAVVNTNAGILSSLLSREGYQVRRHLVLPDEQEEVARALREALVRTPLVVATGGLGPTCDDITRAAALAALDLPFPDERAHVLVNPVGSEPGLVFWREGRALVLLPGVPEEMRALCADQLLPYLRIKMPADRRLHVEELHFCLLAEQAVDSHIRRMRQEHPRIRAGIYPSSGVLTVRLTGEDPAELSRCKERLAAAFPREAFESPSGSIAEAIQTLCVQRKKTVAFAESCTGGALASLVTAIPGASDYFLGSCVVYANALKRRVLSVSEKTLQQRGAVSGEAVQEMLSGLFALSGADYGVAVSGIAGPGGGSEGKPVGTIWAALGARGKEPQLCTFTARGSRSGIIHAASCRLLCLLWIYLQTH
jgi:nicotinamide-nucleotide amidase